MTKARDNADNWAADITGVTAGTGITGGGTSGTVTVTADLSTSVASTSTTQAATPSAVKEAYDLANAAIPASIADAKGDLIVATAADTVTRLPVGTNNQLLTADSATTSGVKWADAPASGSLTLISTTTLSGSQVNLTSIPQTYKSLYLRVVGYRPTSSVYTLNFRFNNDATNPAYLDTPPQTYGARSFNSNGWTSFDVSYGADSSSQTYQELYIPDYSNTSYIKHAISYGWGWQGSGNYSIGSELHAWNSTQAVTTINIFFAGGTFSSGTVYLYGVN